jgi:hypothetical protein
VDLSSLAIDLSQWMIGLDHVSIVAPILVQIAKQTFAGARYSEDFEGVYAERLYLLGELPPLYRRSQRRICFRTPDSDYDWFLTAWYRRIAANTELDEASPYGSHLILTMYSSLES